MNVQTLMGFLNGRLVQFPLADVAGAVLPDRTGKAGLFLTTDGVNLFWATATGGGGNALFWDDSSQIQWADDGSNVEWNT